MWTRTCWSRWMSRADVHQLVTRAEVIGACLRFLGEAGPEALSPTALPPGGGTGGGPPSRL